MIQIVPYQAEWPAEFAAIGETLRTAVGNLALRIDHIGSTAVPGLAAKDLIDVQITARSLAPEIQSALQAAGYDRLEHITQDHIPPGGDPDVAEWTKWFFRPTDRSRAINLHVRLAGRANQRYPLLFRDYLRAHPATADAYAQVKMALVAHRLDDMDAYYDIKDPVCDIIIAGAEAWAVTSGWVQGATDR